MKPASMVNSANFANLPNAARAEDSASAVEPPNFAFERQTSVRQRGQSAVEYLIVVSLLALALVIGPDSVLEALFRAVGDRYQMFTYAMSRP